MNEQAIDAPTQNCVPFTEKYRATNLTNVILNPINRQILSNIITKQHFPNLLFYGPPGTGKTTTIINLINEYQQKWSGAMDRRAVIHLNASDERGIEVIRNQIHQFVNSKNLFSQGLKFVILDEVDYMTKNAQQALRYLIQLYSSTVRFCLICNYISRLDEGLQNELVRLNFNRLPPQPITDMLTDIVKKEDMHISLRDIESIQHICGSDVRSMINYIQTMQSSHSSASLTTPVMNTDVWEALYLDITMPHILKIANTYQWDRKSILKGFAKFLIRTKPAIITPEFMSFIEIIMHLKIQSDHYTQYAVSKFHTFIHAHRAANAPKTT